MVEQSVSKAARRNSFFFAAVRGRQTFRWGPRVCIGSVPSFGARRAPASTFQELNEKFFGAGFIQERTPCAGGACRRPSACACPAPPPATRRGPATTRVRYCARAGGHCGFAWLGHPGREPGPQSSHQLSREIVNSSEHAALPNEPDRVLQNNLMLRTRFLVPTCR